MIWEDGRRGVLKTKGVKHIPNVGLGSAGDDSEKADGGQSSEKPEVWISQHLLTHLSIPKMG